jgi:hypothetical protein
MIKRPLIRPGWPWSRPVTESQAMLIPPSIGSRFVLCTHTELDGW